MYDCHVQTLHACASGLALLVAPLVVAFVSPKLGPEALAQVSQSVSVAR